MRQFGERSFNQCDWLKSLMQKTNEKQSTNDEELDNLIEIIKLQEFT